VRRVGFVIDHPKRDLPGGALLAHELAARGVETYLVPLYEQGIDVPLLGLDAIVVNYARPINFDLVRSYAAAGIATYVLDTEGGVVADAGHSTPSALARYMRESGYAALLSGYFFWGPLMHAAFLADGAMAPARLHLTGCPRFDYLAPGLRALTPPRRMGHVLINTNYPGVNPRFAGKADDRAAMRAVGYEDAFIDSLFEDLRGVMRGMIETVTRLSGDFPAQTFVVRPHPFENVAPYRRAFAGRSNVEVDGGGTVAEALAGASAMLHLNCGTAIEALMLDIIPYALEFLNTGTLRNFASLPSRASRPVASYEELAAIIAAGGGDPGFDFAQRYRAVAEPYFYLRDGRAAQRVADTLATDLQAASPTARRRTSLRRSLAASRPAPRLGQRLQAALANVAGSAAGSALRSAVQRARRDKALSRAATADRLAALARHRQTAPVRVSRARHPWTGMALASLRVRPAAAPTGASR
jgi:surface carbohydrate biosynthesis protein